MLFASHVVHESLGRHPCLECDFDRRGMATVPGFRVLDSSTVSIAVVTSFFGRLLYNGVFDLLTFLIDAVPSCICCRLWGPSIIDFECSHF